MFVFNEDRLQYLLSKLKTQLDKKIDKEQYIKSVEADINGELTIVDDNTNPIDSTTQITLSEANRLKASGNVALNIGGKVKPTYADKVLSEAIFTAEEKAALNYLLENGSIDDILDDKLDGRTIVVLDQEEYEAANKNFFSNLYIIVDSDENGNEKLPVQLELNKLAKAEAFNELLNKKADKEVLSAEVATDGTHEVVADDKEPFDFGSMIKISDPALNGLTVNIGDHVNILSEKVLTDFNYTEEDDKAVELMKDLGAENLLTESDIVKSFPIDIDNVDENGAPSPEEQRKVLAATLGRELEVDYLSSKKYRYLSQEEYNALLDADGNFIGDADPDNKDIIHRIDEGAEVLYGLTEEQVLELKAAYEYSRIDKDDLYAKREEVIDARKTLNGKSFSSLSKRLLDIDETIKRLFYEVDNMDDALDAYGVHVDFEEQTFTRICKAKDFTSNRDFDNVYPWSEMKRLNIKDGVIGAYEGQSGYAEDGSAGDVMVKIPKFYYKVVPVRLEPASSGEGQQIVEAKWMVSKYPLRSFKVHPAFVRNGREVDAVYVGAFEACLYDVSEGKYLENGEQTFDTNNDIIKSIANIYPMIGTYEQIRGFDFSISYELCKKRGIGYSQFDFTTLSAIQLLFLIEYNSFDVQTCIGYGNSISRTLIATNSSKNILYHSIENLWGNTTTYIDGFIFTNNYVYWTNDNFVLNNINNYKKINFKLPIENGYIDKIGYDRNNDFVFLPTRATGSNNIAINDPYSKISPDTLLFLYSSGHHSNYEAAGLWYMAIASKSGSGTTTGARIQYYK